MFHFTLIYIFINLYSIFFYLILFSLLPSFEDCRLEGEVYILINIFISECAEMVAG